MDNPNQLEIDIQTKVARLTAVVDEIGKVIVGQRQVIEELMIAILAGGHCLLEGVPGLAKTLMVSTLAETMALQFKRVQFTPDLMPSDILGTEILEEDHASGKRFFKFQQGPVFTNLMLADEINRTPPKSQAALLEAMQEKRVSYGGKTYALPSPFFVLATQNPLEQSGTYPLPEAQLDRFLMFVRVDYPTEAEEMAILRRTTGTPPSRPQPLIDAETLLSLQATTREVEISDALIAYIARLVRQTRPKQSQLSQVKKYIRWGAGPRAGQALVLCAKATALIDSRYSVTLSDIERVLLAVMRHRILINFQAEADKVSVDDLVAQLLNEVDKPTTPLK